MGKFYDEITPELADWLGQQHLFFVAAAPLAADGLLNCSWPRSATPAGMRSRVTTYASLLVYPNGGTLT